VGPEVLGDAEHSEPRDRGGVPGETGVGPGGAMTPIRLQRL
jgi:hypothetical protein